MTKLQPRQDGLTRITVAQGETQVTSDESIILTTVLGSCIAACLYDPVARLGGVNHYLLADGTSDDPSSMQRYGLHAMEVLINEMMSFGAIRSRLKARIYGGASMRSGFRDIGGANIAFARKFLQTESIDLVGESVGGTSARRVEFRGATGLTRCRIVDDKPKSAILPTIPKIVAPDNLGSIDFF